ncbi:hypothetical protein ACWT_5046 [Actinoplanes sp. SE50]|uniref:hypothetical protein n=1 Tax=unclassified Actinoplanes TaxID=2626549 RepID=UPI00023ECEFB|nr:MULTISPECIES: hypothetical protein [unclassified Actinoplanes]AEV86063.1 hypothetical protein ACPL_5176 [Actinoplanes sp. SE50/110]ATO84461.1 hypothetical protein ACWT_5046 [Actinoplanes sp. SE50]SLM01871.1 hypothetical protein ACSP50_5109 [Actinoplanes sp. SE50/110]
MSDEEFIHTALVVAFTADSGHPRGLQHAIDEIYRLLHEAPAGHPDLVIGWGVLFDLLQEQAEQSGDLGDWDALVDAGGCMVLVAEPGTELAVRAWRRQWQALLLRHQATRDPADLRDAKVAATALAAAAAAVPPSPHQPRPRRLWRCD